MTLDLLERPQVLQPVVGTRQQRHEADRVDLRSLQRVRHGFDVRAGAHEDRAAVVAAHAQDRAGELLEQVPERRDVDECEQQRPVEDVVARELLALDDREDHDHERGLEERGDDTREARPDSAFGVEVRAGEQQQRHEDGQRGNVLGLVEGQNEVRLVAQVSLQLERRPDGQEDAERIQGAERDHARDRAQRPQMDQGAQQERAPGAHVPRREFDTRRGLQLL